MPQNPRFSALKNFRIRFQPDFRPEMTPRRPARGPKPVKTPTFTPKPDSRGITSEMKLPNTRAARLARVPTRPYGPGVRPPAGIARPHCPRRRRPGIAPALLARRLIAPAFRGPQARSRRALCATPSHLPHSVPVLRGFRGGDFMPSSITPRLHGFGDP